MLQAAVVGEDDVQDLTGELRREALDLLDLAAHQVVTEGDLPMQATEVRQFDVCPGTSGIP